jgi:hypothetical protein
MKTLLLDIDGVIIRDKPLLKHVSDNCVQYVATKLPHAKNPAESNRLLYLGNGHTARGLERTFKIDASDFNEKVYTKQLINHLYEVIYGNEFQQDAKEIHEIVKSGWNVTLFTNSPYEWAGPIASAIDTTGINIVCPSRDWSKAHFKPEAGAYINFPKDVSYVFVDDSLKNLGTSRWLPNWKSVYFCEDKHLNTNPEWCPTIGSIWELGLFVNSIDQEQV